jgi:hypothetical protein
MHTRYSDVDANFQFHWNTVGLGKTLMTIAIIVAMHRHNRNDVSLFFNYYVYYLHVPFFRCKTIGTETNTSTQITNLYKAFHCGMPLQLGRELVKGI